MELRLRVSGDEKQLYIKVGNIPLGELRECAKGYFFEVRLKKIQFRMDLSSIYYQELRAGRLRVNQFLFKKDPEEAQFMIKFPLDLNEVFHEISEGRVRLSVDINEGIQVRGYLSIRKEQLKPYVDLEEKPPHVIEKLKDVTPSPLKPRPELDHARWKNDRRETYDALFYKFNHSMNQHMEKQKRFGGTKNASVNTAALRKKGIYHDKFGDNKCDNCYYFRGDRCSLHLVDVTIDHMCFMHRGYREVQGGGFSPR